MLRCASVSGVRPVRRASTKSASDPSISSGEVVRMRGDSIPSEAPVAGSTRSSATDLSPSQVAEPCDPLARQTPFQDVSSPRVVQVPV